MLQHFASTQFLRFLGVGGTAALLHWASRIVLSQWLPFAWAVAAAYAVGMLVAFLLNRRYVFPRSARPAHLQLRDFVVVNLAFFPVVWGATLLLERLLLAAGMTTYPQAVAHAAAIAIPVLATFLLYKLHAFKDADDGR